MACDCDKKHVTFYRGHRITLKYLDGYFGVGWLFEIDGEIAWKNSENDFREDYQAYDAATKHIDAELAKPNTDGE